MHKKGEGHRAGGTASSDNAQSIISSTYCKMPSESSGKGVTDSLNLILKSIHLYS